MKKVLIVYHSQSGNTEAMAKAVSEGAKCRRRHGYPEEGCRRQCRGYTGLRHCSYRHAELLRLHGRDGQGLL